MSNNELKSVELSDKQIAFVMNKNKDNTAVGMYIPSVMSEIDMGNKVWTKTYTPKNNMISNSNVKIKFQEIELTNTFIVEPKNISNVTAPNLGIGERVWVSFVDNDLKKCIYTDESVDETQRTTDSYSISVMAREKLSDKESKYEFNMDSDTQKIELKTTDKNGEKDELNFIMNGKHGEIRISTSDGSINMYGDTTDILSNLCVNGINIMDTLSAMRNEIFDAINQVVDQTNAVLDSTVSNLNSSLDDVKGYNGTVSAGSVGSVRPSGEIGTKNYLTINGVSPSSKGYQVYKESEYDKDNSNTQTSDKTDSTVVASSDWHWPTNTKRITCGYLGYSGHYAIDIGARYAPLYAANNGVVQTVQKKSTGYGWMIFINHQNGYYSRYAHLSEIYVKVGDTVNKGQLIGTTGNTGNSTGPHLHFEIRTDTKSQPSYAPNPLSFYK